VKTRFGYVRIGYKEELDVVGHQGMRFGPFRNLEGTVEWVDWHNDLFADMERPNEKVVLWAGSRGRILHMIGISFCNLSEDEYYRFYSEAEVVTQQSICERLHVTGYCSGRLPELEEILILRFRDNEKRQPWLRREGENLAATQEGAQRWLKEGCQICKGARRSSSPRVTVGELLFPTTRGLCPKPTAVDLMDNQKECTNPDCDYPNFYIFI
jgi:hypothetical protein